jgi:hypothetical protein
VSEGYGTDDTLAVLEAVRREIGRVDEAGLRDHPLFGATARGYAPTAIAITTRDGRKVKVSVGEMPSYGPADLGGLLLG